MIVAHVSSWHERPMLLLLCGHDGLLGWWYHIGGRHIHSPITHRLGCGMPCGRLTV